jgi:hypothetical protein
MGSTRLKVTARLATLVAQPLEGIQRRCALDHILKILNIFGKVLLRKDEPNCETPGAPSMRSMGEADEKPLALKGHDFTAW